MSANVYVFIAKDETEYSRYNLQPGADGGDGDELSGVVRDTCRWRYCRRSQQLRIVVRKGKIGMPDELKGRMKALKNGSGYENEIEAETEDNVQLEVEDLQNAVNELLVGLTSGNGNPLLPEAFSCHLFIHWGGGELSDIEFYERTVQGFMEHDWKVFSTGTNRKDFFVRDETGILIPYDCGGLVRRFECARRFAGIKNVLTRFANPEIAAPTDKDRELFVDFLAQDEVRNDLRAAMRDPQIRWMKDWEAFRGYLEAPEKTVKEKAAIFLDDDKEHIKAFAAQLLTIPHLLSEGLLG